MQRGTRTRRFGRGSGGIAVVIAAVTGGSDAARASDADLAVTIDLAIEAVGAAATGDWSTSLTPSTDLAGLEYASQTVSLAGGTPPRDALNPDLDPILDPSLTRWSQPDPSSDQLILVPLPAPLWAGICGLVTVAVGRRLGSNRR